MKIIKLFFFLIYVSSVAQNEYLPDASLRKNIADTLWDEVKSKTPKEALIMVEYFIKSDEVFNLYEGVMKKHKLKPYEIASVAGFVEDVCNEIITGKEASESESIANVKKMQIQYTSNKIDDDLSADEMQKKYDYLILKAIWLGTINELANKNSALAKEISKQILNEYQLSNFKGSTATTNTIAEIPKAVPNPNKIPKENSNFNYTVKDVVMITTTSYGLEGMYISNDVYALFANGECLFEPSEPLESLDISKSKKAKPKHWDTWHFKNNIFCLTDGEDGKVSDWKNWFKVRPAKNGFIINGKFKTLDPFTGASIINSSAVYFDKQGNFEWKTTKGGTGGWKPILVNKNSSGTYKINNRTITLNYNNGTSESYFFGLYPKDDKHFIIGSSHFVPVN